MEYIIESGFDPNDPDLREVINDAVKEANGTNPGNYLSRRDMVLAILNNNRHIKEIANEYLISGSQYVADIPEHLVHRWVGLVVRYLSENR